MLNSPLWTTHDVCESLPRYGGLPLARPKFTGELNNSKRVGLLVEEMSRHTTDEGWQLQLGLIQEGYKPYGYRFENSNIDAVQIIENEGPGTTFIQDKREWDKSVPSCQWQERRAHFENTERLCKFSDTFKVTVLKDSHSRQGYNTVAAEGIGLHAWLIYYHPNVVIRTAPFVRREHLIRIYHSIDSSKVPAYSDDRAGCLISGAVSAAYPLRQRLIAESNLLPQTKVLNHPGYHAKGSDSSRYLKHLTEFQVSICTASKYGFALRKIVESVACGCICVTDLPVDDILPAIDDCLVRVHPSITVETMADVIRDCYSKYNPERQKYYAELAKNFYDYRVAGTRVANQIEEMRCGYLA